LSAQKPDRSLYVVNLRWETSLGSLPKIDARHRKAVIEKRARRIGFRAVVPGASVNPNNQRG
jgi:hypothetical protein